MFLVLTACSGGVPASTQCPALTVASGEAAAPGSASGSLGARPRQDGPVACPGRQVLVDDKCLERLPDGLGCKENDASCEDLCAKGNQASCAHQAQLLINTKKDDARGARLLLDGCMAGYPPACTLFGTYFAPPQTRTTNPRSADAIRALERGCAFGEINACELVSISYGEGVHVEPNPGRSFAYQQRACEARGLSRCAAVAVRFIAGEGVTADVVKGVDMLERSCRGGDAESCWRLGTSLVEGRRVPKDVAQGIAWIEQACDANPKMCLTSGEMFARGDSLVPRDATRARAMLERGCSLTTAREQHECVTLGGLYERGEGGPRDLARAELLYTSQCNEQFTRGCADAARFYATGVGGKKDPVKALAVAELGCKHEALAACMTQGHLLESRDRARARQVYASSCKLTGNAEACQAARRLGAAVP